MDKLHHIALRLKAMADTALLFTKDEYDKERYIELADLSNQLLAIQAGENIQEVENFFSETTDYPTPKVDVRGFLLNDKQEVLMVKEKADGKWTIPGGWCEIGFSPKENVAKEMKEETGITVDVDRILAVFDKRCHPHPARPHYVYKLIYLCKSSSYQLNPNHEIADAQFFNINKLPELSTDRIVKSQLEILYNKVLRKDLDVYSD